MGGRTKARQELGIAWARRGTHIAWLCVAVACNSIGDDGGDDASTNTTAMVSSSDSASTGTTAAVDGTTAAVDGTTEGTTSGTGEATCPDVMFSYNVAFTAMQFECSDMHDGTNTCAVTQTGCMISWGCNGALGNYLPDGPIDANGVYVGESDYKGMPMTCTVTFVVQPYGFEFECMTAGMTCTGSGF